MVLAGIARYYQLLGSANSRHFHRHGKMNHDHAFLNSILANPSDRILRLVYADWLEERGDHRGEYLRILCRLERYLRPAPASEAIARKTVE
jgi:uncharacterized protein (TIGR02996 family)